MDPTKGTPITIEDKPLFDSYLKKYPPEISELTFTNLFIWRKYYDFLFLEFKDHLIVYSKSFLKNKWKANEIRRNDTLYFLPPIGASPDLILIDLIQNLNHIEFHKVTEQIAEKVNQNRNLGDSRIEIIEDRDNWDYVYEIKDLIELPGNKYRQNRRWLTKFLSSNNYEFSVITEDSINICKKLQLEWCVRRGCKDDEALYGEQIAINEALEHFKELNYKGGLLCVGDKCVGFTFGEMLNKDNVVIHIEKAHIEFEGSYQAINHLFLKNCYPDVKFVNREQDLGILGLKKAKESYKPHHMVEKKIIVKK